MVQKPSKRFTLNKNDMRKWAVNSLIFLAPFILVFLLAIQEGKNVTDALYVLYLYALNVAIDLLKKFIANK